MAVEIAVTGHGAFAGARSNVVGYSAQEDATSIDPNDTSGGVGQINFTAVEGPLSPLLMGNTITVTDQSNGTTTGTVTNLESQDGVMQVTANSRLGLLLSTVQTNPYSGTLDGALRYYLGLCGITTGILIDATIGARTVVYPGFGGVMYDNFRQILAAQQIEMSLVSNNIVIRPLRTRVLNRNTELSNSWTLNAGDLAQSVDVHWYTTSNLGTQTMFPYYAQDYINNNNTAPIYQVDAEQVLEFDIPLNASVTNVVQPVYVASVDPNYTSTTTSVYTASGNDGLPMTPSYWATNGGNLVVTINPDTVSLHVVLTGPKDLTGNTAPYRIAMSSGPSDYYNALYLVCTGVSYTQHTLNVLSGIEASKAPTVVGATIDSLFINDAKTALTVGLITAGKYASPEQQVTITATVVNRKGDKGDANYPTFASFDTMYAGKTYSQLNSILGTKTYTQFDADLFASVASNFDNQAFGNVAGGRLQYGNAMYRVMSATITQDSIQYTAQRDTLFSDFSAANAGLTYAQWDAKFAGRTYSDFGVIPLA